MVDLRQITSQVLPMSKEKPLVFESLPDANLTFHPPSLTHGLSIQMNGKPLKKKGRKYMLPEPHAGKFIELKMGLDMYAPTLEYGNEKVTPVDPLPLILQIVALLPMGLVGFGGLVGGALGGAAWALNMSFLHSDNSLPIRILGMLVITGFAVGSWLVIAGKASEIF